MMPVRIAVEGTGDVPVAKKILAVAGLEMGDQYIQRGKASLDDRVPAYNQAARFAPWFVLRDLDHDAPCPGELARTLVPAPARMLRLRVAVRSAEAWLLADRTRIAEFLRVRAAVVPADPEGLFAPKVALVNVARQSRSRQIREDMVPARGHTAQVGPLYVARLTEFVEGHWRPDIAAGVSLSLRRTLAALQGLAAQLQAE